MYQILKITKDTPRTHPDGLAMSAFSEYFGHNKGRKPLVPQLPIEALQGKWDSCHPNAIVFPQNFIDLWNDRTQTCTMPAHCCMSF